jgi:ABC-type antimicrobial peptide transport system ATPase subunit
MRVLRRILTLFPFSYSPVLNNVRTKQFVRMCSALPKEKREATHEFPLDRIRNFSIIAHVDHGKSTLADRILEYVGAIAKPTEGQQKNEQVLDKLQVERERGITVKSQTVSFYYNYNGTTYQMNLIGRFQN